MLENVSSYFLPDYVGSFRNKSSKIIWGWVYDKNNYTYETYAFCLLIFEFCAWTMHVQVVEQPPFRSTFSLIGCVMGSESKGKYQMDVNNTGTSSKELPWTVWIFLNQGKSFFSLSKDSLYHRYSSWSWNMTLYRDVRGPEFCTWSAQSDVFYP